LQGSLDRGAPLGTLAPGSHSPQRFDESSGVVTGISSASKPTTSKREPGSHGKEIGVGVMMGNSSGFFKTPRYSRGSIPHKSKPVKNILNSSS
jgi:hypothetical protein